MYIYIYTQKLVPQVRGAPNQFTGGKAKDQQSPLDGVYYPGVIHCGLMYQSSTEIEIHQCSAIRGVP